MRLCPVGHEPNISWSRGNYYYYYYYYIYYDIYILLLLLLLLLYTYTHVQFEQLHKYIQNKNKMYKKWHTHTKTVSRYKIICVYLGINGIDKEKLKGDVELKNIESFIVVVVMSCNGLDFFKGTLISVDKRYSIVALRIWMFSPIFMLSLPKSA